MTPSLKPLGSYPPPLTGPGDYPLLLFEPRELLLLRRCPFNTFISFRFANAVVRLVRPLAIVAVLLLLAGWFHADSGFDTTGCATRAYLNACKQCPFDASGKMEGKCYDNIQGSGISCVSAAHPKAAAMYALGQCKAVDTCIQRLEACKGKMSVGNDKKDCAGYVVSSCFSEADDCMASAERSCEKTPVQTNKCVIPIGLALLVMGGGIGGSAWRQMKGPAPASAP